MSKTKNKTTTATLMDLLARIVMGFLALYSIYASAMAILHGSIANLGAIIVDPWVLAMNGGQLALAVFAILYTHATYKHKNIPVVARNIAYTFTVLSFVVLIVLAAGAIKNIAGEHCTGLFGVQTSCISNSMFLLAVLFLAHPFGYIALGISAFLGLWSLINNLYRRKR